MIGSSLFSIPMHVQRDIVLENPPVRLSVCLCVGHTLVLCLNEYTSWNSFQHLDRGMTLVFDRYRR